MESGKGHQVLERGMDSHFSVHLALEGRGGPWDGSSLPHFWVWIVSWGAPPPPISSSGQQSRCSGYKCVLPGPRLQAAGTQTKVLTLLVPQFPKL